MLPCFCVDNRLMVVLENRLFLNGIFHIVLDLVRGLFRLEVHQTASVLLVFQQMNDGVLCPLAFIARGVAAGACPFCGILVSLVCRFVAPLAYGQSWLGRSRQGKAGISAKHGCGMRCSSCPPTCSDGFAIFYLCSVTII